MLIPMPRPGRPAGEQKDGDDSGSRDEGMSAIETRDRRRGFVKASAADSIAPGRRLRERPSSEIPGEAQTVERPVEVIG